MSLTHGFFYSLTGNAYGSADNPQLTFTSKVNLKAGVNKIALLSASVGLAVSICIPDKSNPLFLMLGKPRSCNLLVFTFD